MSASFSVDLTEAALVDLRQIYDWLAREAGRTVADRLIDAILAQVETLEQFPARGSPVPELAGLGLDAWRQMPVAPYRMIYRVRENRVTIILIVHARRDLQALLAERLLR